MPLPPDWPAAPPWTCASCPGGVSNTTHGEGTRRGVGFAVGFKNIAFAEGFDDYSTARVRLSLTTASAVRRDPHRRGRGGPGAGDRAGADRAHRAGRGAACGCCPPTPRVGSAGSTLGLAPDLDERRRRAAGLRPGARSSSPRARRPGDEDAPLEVLLADGPVDETAVYRHRPTQPLDPETGQGDSLVALAFAAHRAVCDVDAELGLVRAVEIATTQDVGRA